ncbi:MAG: hypothetical protein ACHQNV_01985 [Vicinamibacteria bacterium]
MAALLFMFMVFGLVVMLPLLVVSVALRVAVGLALLPFKLLGGLLRLGFGVIGGLLRLAFGAVGFLALALGVVFCVVLLPLLPFLIVGGLLFAIVRLAAGPSHPRAAF